MYVSVFFSVFTICVFFSSFKILSAATFLAKQISVIFELLY